MSGVECGDCVRYTSGPKRGQVFMRCPVCAVIALGGDRSSVEPVAAITAFVKAMSR